MRLPERLHRYHTCSRCGKVRHRSGMFWNGEGYRCDNFGLCDGHLQFNQQMAAYEARDEKAEFEAALARRRAELIRRVSGQG